MGPIVWRDRSGILHACDGAEIHPGIRLLWTACATAKAVGEPGSLDVPADTAWKQRPQDKINCVNCLAKGV